MAVLFMNQFLLIRCDYLFAFQEDYLCHIHYNYKIVDIFILVFMQVVMLNISKKDEDGLILANLSSFVPFTKKATTKCTVYKIWHFIIDFNPKNQEL
ncbi:hypothetical protein T02_14115 [Trichinella nativa]|uniref:Uncharacterized protein n=1 Tax=Trichinella nativa TaxID=6335 RepID=A0A0V1LU46_9BILA|nr:hypothetical protein T02_14115 [Trichinella nativa]